MGVAPGWGGARRLVNIVGRSHALDLLLSCSRLVAEEGRKIGFFNDVLSTSGEDADMVHEAEAWVLGNLLLLELNNILFYIFVKYNERYIPNAYQVLWDIFRKNW